MAAKRANESRRHELLPSENAKLGRSAATDVKVVVLDKKGRRTIYNTTNNGINHYKTIFVP